MDGGAPRPAQSWRLIVAVFFVLGMGKGWAAAPLERELPAPFSTGAPARLAADPVWTVTLAQRALEAGMYHLAEDLFRQVLGPIEEATAGRRSAALGLVSTLLAQDRPGDARKILEAMPGERDGPWRLRRALVTFFARDQGEIPTYLEGEVVNRLPPAEIAWAHFLRAMVEDGRGERGRADSAFQDALAASTSAAASAWFRVARFQSRLNADAIDAAVVEQIARTMEEFAGRRVGFESTLQYAVALDRLGRKSEAIQALLRQRRGLPATEPELREQTLLLLGLIAGVESTDGYTALRDLLDTGTNSDWQRVALQRLGAAADLAGSLARTGLPPLLDSLLNRSSVHPLREDLLFYRAMLSLREQRFLQAEDDANDLLAQYPGSARSRGAQAVLASSSWQRRQYRTAADHVARIQSELPAGPERARLAVLIAECHFRAGETDGAAEDYRNAADAYAAAQEDLQQVAEQVGSSAAEQAAGLDGGTLYFQRVLSLIRGGAMGDAAELLSGPVADAVDPESRWQAAWNYVRLLQLNGRVEEAFRRLDEWGAIGNAPGELRLKFLWLAAQLTIETKRSEETEARLAAVRSFLGSAAGGSVTPEVRADVESNAALLAAQALLEENETEAGIRAMNRLRVDFPNSKAAIFSFIVQARYLSAAGQLVEAQKWLRDLADTHPTSEYAPRALFEAAEQAKKRGADTYLEEAKELLERLAIDPNYRDDPFVFFARMEQGDILRKLNQFAAAEQVYLLLENNYPNHASRSIAQLSLADTLMAQVPNDVAKFDAAISRLERLTDLPTAEPDLRIEAGYKLGRGWLSQGDVTRAGEIYWDVYQRFLGGPPGDGGLPVLGSRGHYWIARALLDLGEIEQKANRLESARYSYEAILRHGLPGAALARGRLAQLQAGG